MILITKEISICTRYQTATDDSQYFPSRLVLYRFLVCPASDIRMSILRHKEFISKLIRHVEIQKIARLAISAINATFVKEETNVRSHQPSWKVVYSLELLWGVEPHTIRKWRAVGVAGLSPPPSAPAFGPRMVGSTRTTSACAPLTRWSYIK